ncbi:unnamed protein product [Blepharisma stoltei]|uniref:Uncharacterized protein n=1 Tax=Blepharisma stoltei TaxID=1481888 RepID=A0AAU9IT18_9CILI|nr:unnamed protein product [Blepharisma stoltei]
MIKNKKSLENLKQLEEYGLSNTPRTIEACLREGIKPQDLLPKSSRDFKKIEISPKAEQSLSNFFEKKRLFLIRKVIKAKNNLLNEDVKTKPSNSLSLSDRVFGDSIANKEKHNRELRTLIDHELQYSLRPAIKDEISTEKSKLDSFPIITPRKIKTAESKSRKKPAENKDFDWKAREEEEIRKLKLIKEQKAKDAEERRLRNAEKFRMHIEMTARKTNKEFKMKQKMVKMADAESKERLEKIRRMNEQRKMELNEISHWKKEKLERVRKQIEKEQETRRLQYYQKWAKEDKVLNQLNKEQQKYLNNIHISYEKRTRKTLEKKEIADKEDEMKRQKFSEGLAKRFEKLEKRDTKSQQDLRKNKKALRELNNKLNLEQVARKEKFLKSESIDKIQSKSQRIQSFIEAKEEIKRINALINSKSEIKKNKIKDEMYKMAVTKKWDLIKLENLIDKDL